jgi:hypothetical protein
MSLSRTTRRLAAAVLPLILFLALAGPAAAQTTWQPRDTGDFRFVLAPYAWVAGMTGTVGIRGFQTKVDESFADIVKYINGGFMIHGEMLYRDTAGLLGEFNYAALGDQVSHKRVSIDGQMSLVLVDIAGYYRLGTFSLGKDGGCPTSFDLLAGTRIWSLAGRLRAETAQRELTISKQTAWVDPIVGARATLHLTGKWLLELRGGVGGFGAGSAFTWDAMGLAGYSFWSHGTLLAGYRAVGVTRNQGSGKDFFKFDATLNGPVLALAFIF